MNILLNGICGHMGKEVVKLCEAGYRGARLVVGVDPNAVGSEAENSVCSFKDIISINNVDCIVDFSPALASFLILPLKIPFLPLLQRQATLPRKLKKFARRQPKYRCSSQQICPSA